MSKQRTKGAKHAARRGPDRARRGPEQGSLAEDATKEPFETVVIAGVNAIERGLVTEGAAAPPGALYKARCSCCFLQEAGFRSANHNT